MITFETAKQMKELGLIQKRHDHARYYINENTIAYFEDIKNTFEAKEWWIHRGENAVNWLDNFTYIPELIDLIGIQSYDLTLDAAVWHFIDGKKSYQQEDIKRSEQIMTGDSLVVSGDNPLQTWPKESIPKVDKQTVIADSTLEGIERIKQAIQKNATQNIIPAI